MKDPIEREDAIEVVKRQRKISWENWHETRPSAERIIEDLKELPSAQPEIIHCRECRWRNDQNGSTAWLPCRAIVTPSDFCCGRAERRTG